MRTLGAILCALLWSGFFAPRCGATVHYSNGSAASVQALHNAALDGDTITLPAGTFTWSRPVTISKAITLQGAGVGSTVLLDLAQNESLISWRLVPNLRSRMTGIEFRDGGRASEFSGGIIKAAGAQLDETNPYDARTMRIDHCKFDHLNGVMTLFNDVLGVVDHNTFISPSADGAHRESAQIYHRKWGGYNFGDGSWIDSNHFGSDRFLFFEDNIFANSPIDSYAGARVVARYNTFDHCMQGAHGTESTGRARGTRAVENYNNTFVGNGSGGALMEMRSGVALIHDNICVNGGLGLTRSFVLDCYRIFHAFPIWGGADGSNARDVNRPGPPFWSGTATSGGTGRDGTLNITVAGAGWTPNEWIGYTVVKTSHRGDNNFSMIVSNTSSTMTYLSNGDFGANMTFAPGDTFYISKVDEALDSCGRSGGWNPQADDPCYEWNNLDEATGQPIHFHAAPIIRSGEHYFNSTQAPDYVPYIYPHPLTLVPVGAARASVTDFNGDGSPDYVLQKPSTHETAIWYLDNNVYTGSDSGPTLPANWDLRCVADFDLDSHADYGVFNPRTGQTVIGYLSGPTLIGAAFGPTLPGVWTLVGVADFNGDSKPDYLLCNPRTGQTVIGYLSGPTLIGAAFGLTLPALWTLVGAADFNGDGKPDYLLYNVNTRETAICYLDNNICIGAARGPTLPSIWTLVGTADFNGDSKPDYLLYDVNTQETGIYYLDNNIYIGAAWGPTLPPGWSFFGP